MTFKTTVSITLIIILMVFNHQVLVAEENTKVLVLNSYHKGYLWSDEITEGIEDALKDTDCSLHIEYMDTKRQFDTTYMALLCDLLTHKNKKHKYDILITSDNNAFKFAKKFRKTIFADIPLVFCGVNYIDSSDIAGIRNITGVNEKADLSNNIKLIHALHPSCKDILIISDNTTTGKRIQHEVSFLKKDASAQNINLALVYDLSIDSLTSLLKDLNSETVVLYTFFFRDKNNTFFEYDESARLICSSTSVPVYGSWTFSLGFGIVGGYLTSGYDQGLLAGNKALEILNGKPINEVGIDFNPPAQLMFDYQVLQKHNIELGKFKNLAIIKNEPQSFFEKYKWLIRNLTVAIALLSISTIVLSFLLRRVQLVKTQLASSEKRLRSIIDTLPSLLFVKNKRGKFLAVNKTMAASMGLKTNEMEGRYHKDIHPNEEELIQMLEEDQKVLKSNQELHSFEKSYHDIYGKQHWIQTIKSPLPKDVFGEEAIIGISMDITSLNETKKNLKAIHEFNQNILETANVIVIAFDAEMKVNTFNRFAEELTGYTKDEIINTDCLNQFIPLEDQENLRTAFTKMLEGNIDYAYNENYIYTKNGEKRLIAWNNSILNNLGGKRNGLLNIGIDITDKREATLAIIQSENKFKSIFDYSPFGILYYDTNGCVIDCNHSFVNLFSSSKEVLVGTDLNQLPDKNLVIAINDSLTKGVGTYDHVYLATTSTKEIPLKGTFRGIKNSSNEIVGGIAMTEDITLQKDSEQKILNANKELLDITNALKQANKELSKALSEAEKKKDLEKANELLFRQKTKLTSTIKQLKDAQSQLIEAEKMASVGVLTSGIAHEINNPLNFIQGGRTAIELHLQDYHKKSMAEFEPFLGMIDDGIERAVEIIKSLNRFNRRTDTYDEVCHMDQIIENCLVMTQNQFKHRIEITKSYEHKDATFNGNEGKIHQVVLNILNNAEQAIPDKGKISISTIVDNHHIKAVFQDSGSGIKPEHLKRISDPFFTTKDPGKGTGLGLSIAYNILHDHHGTIQYESEVGKGTMVSITLPLGDIKN